MPLLICAPTEKELRAALPERLPENIGEMRPFALKSHVCMVTGVGPLNATLAIGRALGWENDPPIKSVLLLGLAGAFDLETQPLRSIWRVDREFWPEYGLNDGQTVTARAFSFPLWEKDGKKIYDTLELADLSALEKWTGSRIRADWQACASITVAGVTAGFARKNEMWAKWHAPLENMEGFAAAYAAARAGIPCVELRVVSNKVGPRTRDEKDFEGALREMSGILPALNLI